MNTNLLTTYKEHTSSFVVKYRILKHLIPRLHINMMFLFYKGYFPIQ